MRVHRIPDAIFGFIFGSYTEFQHKAYESSLLMRELTHHTGREHTFSYTCKLCTHAHTRTHARTHTNLRTPFFERKEKIQHPHSLPVYI